MPLGIKYGKWEEDSMSRAIDSVRNGDMGVNAAARAYGVPRATLQRRLKGKNCFAVGHKKIIGSMGDLPEELEEELVSHVLKLEEFLFGITPRELRILAFEIAEKNHILHRFSQEKKIAGKKWYYSFMRRHPELSLRQPEATSFARAKGFNKENVLHFFDLLERVVDENKLDATRIFNADETGLSTVQKKPRKVLALKGKKAVGSIASGERGSTTTAVCCASAAGQYVPPLLIYKRTRSVEGLQDGAPPGTIFAFNPESGFINKDIFVRWLKHFIETVHPSEEKKVLLLLDGHCTHTRNLEALEIARENGVIILSLPGHTTHRLQPLDVSFFKPLSSYYINEMEKFLRQKRSEGKPEAVTQFHIARLFGKAYGQAATVGTAINGFAKTGVWPVNRDVFQDCHFVAAMQFESDDVPVVEVPGTSLTPSTSGLSHATQAPGRKSVPTTSGTEAEPLPADVSTLVSKFQVSVGEISPIPSKISDGKGSKKAQKTILITSSPYKQILEETEKKKERRGTAVKRRVQSSGPEMKVQRKLPLRSGNKPINSSEDSWFCAICCADFKEDMIQCLSCKVWVHEKCAAVRKGIKMYYCEKCK